MAAVPTGGLAVFGVRAKFHAGSFFRGGLGTPSGVFLAFDETGWQLLPSVAAAAKGLIWPPGAMLSPAPADNIPVYVCLWSHDAKILPGDLGFTCVSTS
jgi:hypothetical protein